MSEQTTSETTPAPAPRKRKRVFMWFFLAIQALFVAWMIVGFATANNTPSASDIASACGGNNWQALYNSYHECVTTTTSDLQAAGGIGTGIGAALVIGLWVAVDVILGITRLVVVFPAGGRHEDSRRDSISEIARDSMRTLTDGTKRRHGAGRGERPARPHRQTGVHPHRNRRGDRRTAGHPATWHACTH